MEPFPGDSSRTSGFGKGWIGWVKAGMVKGSGFKAWNPNYLIKEFRLGPFFFSLSN